jgi:two-component system, OmpR family, response regulator CpxR
MGTALLLVDDDFELCSMMREFFAQYDVQLSICHNGEAGLQEALAGKFDLVLLDVMMPGLDGFAVLERLREKSRVPVLMLTARTDAPSRIRGLDAGADDYLPKPFNPLELLARVRAILRRANPPPDALSVPIDLNGIRIDPASRTVTKDGQPVEVTSFEFEVLDTLVRGAGRVVSRDELMQHLYQRDASPLDRSIDVHVSHLRKKLEAGRTLIRSVRGVGYQFCVSREEPASE